jgi:lipopolysaccharide transport system ATP-binding protein
LNSEVLVKVEGVSKKFCRDLKRSLWYGVKDISSELFGARKDGQLRPKEFWAVDDVSFELRRGECLGLIGHNGAGKSTLLKMLNGLIKPDKGRITMKGRIGALIELGAGFNPILTGRENIYNNGAVLGFSKKEIDAKFDAIVDFAEIDDFIDTPVQNYSSGMKVRLGFAVAAQMEPDVLIVDEVLAVGDLGFRMKCLTKIGQLLKSSSVIFVSHSMPQVARISNRITFLKNGTVEYQSENIEEGIRRYMNEFKTGDKIISGNQKVRLLSSRIFGDGVGHANPETGYVIKYNTPIRLEFEIDADTDAEDYWINIGFIDAETKIIANAFSMFSEVIFPNNGKNKVQLKLDGLPFSLGNYQVSIAINEVREDKSRGDIYYYNSNMMNIEMSGIGAGNSPVQLIGKWFLD